jgi:AAA+ ATPase superfamily predicted ATPase
MSFIGRKHELAVLEKAWLAERSAFIPVYGRRRVGKSELLLHFIAGKPAVYFVGKRAPAEAQIKEFLETAALSLRQPALAQAGPSTWKVALELTLANRAPGKLVVVLDEFQWMVEVSPELPSLLQELWDRSWSRSGDTILVLCGSYLGFMEREVLGKRSPLFGRRTAQILLRPFNHIEAAEFHPRLSTEDHARIYAICGGIPAYLLAFDQKLSVEQNIVANVLEETATLAREPEFLLREELRDLVPYHAVLSGLAQGISKPVDLARAAGIDSRALNYHLSTLVELGYVQRRHPLTEGSPSVRSVRYAIDDPLLRFWFQFVFPHQSLLRLLGPAAGFTELVRPHLDSYFGRCFDRLCREALPLIYVTEGVRCAFTVGEYWDRQVQIDVVGVRQDNWTDIAECKWGAVASLPALTAELDRKVRHYPNRRSASIGRRLFLHSRRSPQQERSDGLQIHTLADLYELPNPASSYNPKST